MGIIMNSGIDDNPYNRYSLNWWWFLYESNEELYNEELEKYERCLFN